MIVTNSSSPQTIIIIIKIICCVAQNRNKPFTFISLSSSSESSLLLVLFLLLLFASSWSPSSIVALPINHFHSCRVVAQTLYSNMERNNIFFFYFAGSLARHDDSDEIKLHSMANKSKIQFQWHTTLAHTTNANGRFFFVLSLSPSPSLFVRPSVCLSASLHCFFLFFTFYRFANRRRIRRYSIFVFNFNFITNRKKIKFFVLWKRPRPHIHKSRPLKNSISNDEMRREIKKETTNVFTAAICIERARSLTVDVRIRNKNFFYSEKKQAHSHINCGCERWSLALVVTLTSNCTLNTEPMPMPKRSTHTVRTTIAI